MRTWPAMLREKAQAAQTARPKVQLVREKSSHILRVQKMLEDANIKLDSVITDVMGMSGRAMIEARSSRARAILPSWPALPIIG